MNSELIPVLFLRNREIQFKFGPVVVNEMKCFATIIVRYFHPALAGISDKRRTSPIDGKLAAFSRINL